MLKPEGNRQGGDYGNMGLRTVGKAEIEKAESRNTNSQIKNRRFGVLTFALGFVYHLDQDGHKFIGFVFQ